MEITNMLNRVSDPREQGLNREIQSTETLADQMKRVILETGAADRSLPFRGETDWENSLVILAAMGFGDKERNKSLLIKHHNNLPSALNELLI